MTRFYCCACFFTHNIYIKDYLYHFKYVNENQFNEDYLQILPQLGCETEDQKSSLIRKIQEELTRKKTLEKEAIERKSCIAGLYKPLNPHVYTFKEKFLHPQFVKLYDALTKSNQDEVSGLLDIISKRKNIYGFPIFTQEFCKDLLEELQNFAESNMPKGRPNSMNHYGVLLDELGFHDNFSLVLREKYMDPLAEMLFPNWRGKKLDSHKIFTVRYEMKDTEGYDKDTELSTHFDNSEVTLNICLGRDFEGGELYFNGLKYEPPIENDSTIFNHKVGYGIMHCGRQVHGAFPIESGIRENIIVWMRSSSVRNNLCPMCDSKPQQLYPSEAYGDGFTLPENVEATEKLTTGCSIH